MCGSSSPTSITFIAKIGCPECSVLITAAMPPGRKTTAQIYRQSQKSASVTLALSLRHGPAFIWQLIMQSRIIMPSMSFTKRSTLRCFGRKNERLPIATRFQCYFSASKVVIPADPRFLGFILSSCVDDVLSVFCLICSKLIGCSNTIQQLLLFSAQIFPHKG